jgi:Fe-S cluster assembly iron-binding protein IscA
MVTITPVAEQKIHELMKEEKDVVGLRIYVRGGGCHGSVRDGIRIQNGRGRYGH